MPKHLRGFVIFAYRSGWRKGEIANLTWRQVDRRQGIITLNSGETKNNEGRTLYLDAELQDVIEEQWERRKESGTLLPYVFTNQYGTDKVGDFRKGWSTAFKKAKFGERLFHDFRRTACRNMIRSGIPERVAMQISGHKTRSVFDRYNVVSESYLRTAAQRQAGYLAEIGSTASTLAHFPEKPKQVAIP